MNDKFRNKYRIASHRMPRWDYSGDGIYFITMVTQNRECILGEIIGGHMSLSEMGKIVDNEWLKSFDIRDELYLDEYIIMPNHLHAIIVLVNNGLHVETHGRASLQSTAPQSNQSTAPQSNQSTVPQSNQSTAPQSNQSNTPQSNQSNQSTAPQSNQSNAPQSNQSNAQQSNQSNAPQSNRSNAPQSNQSNAQQSNQSNQSNRSTQSENRPFFRKPKSISSFIAGFKSAVNSKIDDYIDENGLNIPKYNRNNHFFQPNYHDRIIRNDQEYQRIKKYIINNPTNWGNDTLKSINPK